MALGIPVICAENSALRTICKTGLVRTVPATIEEPAYSLWPERQTHGNNFNCSIENAAAALRDVHDHYEQYLEKASAARRWIASSDSSALRPLYHSLVQPKKVLMGLENQITDDYLMTDSPRLFQKYT